MYSTFDAYPREWAPQERHFPHQGDHEDHPPPIIYPPHNLGSERNLYSMNYEVDYPPLNYYTEFPPPPPPPAPPQSPLQLHRPPFLPIKLEAPDAAYSGSPHPSEERVALVRPRRGGGRKPAKEEALSPEEEQKRAIRRQRNKLAAARCRKRRLDHTNRLLAETHDLETIKLRLKDQIYHLAVQKEELEDILNNHKAVCRFQEEMPDSSRNLAYTQTNQAEGPSFYQSHHYHQDPYMEAQVPEAEEDDFNSGEKNQPDDLKFNAE